MKKIIYLLIFNLIFTISNSQNSSVYSWQDHLSYQSAKLVLEVENSIYCATENGLFYYNKEDYTINRLNKINGLSDIGISTMDYDNENKIIIIAYENCNIDLIKDGDIININDIKLKEIFGNKKVSNIIVKDGIAYLSCTFGLVLLDLKKEEIKDTYKIRDNDVFLEINDCFINDSSIFVGTSKGAYFADVNSNTLFDYNSWTKHPTYPNSEISEIILTDFGIVFNNQGPYIKVKNCNGYYIEIGDETVTIYINGGIFQELNSDTNFVKLQDAWIDKDNILWIADSANSLMKYVNYEYHSTIKPNGPYSNFIENIKVINNEIILLHNSNKNSISKSSDNLDWEIINSFENVISTEEIGDITFYGSSTNGLSKKTKNVIVHYTKGNTQNVLDTNYNISNLIKDDKGNLWGTISNSGKNLFVRTEDNYWTYFWMPLLPNNQEIRCLIIDDYGQKWGSVATKGIFVLNENGTIEDKTDDQYKVIGTTTGNGNLPNKEVYALANDLDGNIWVGTKEGICVFYSPSSVFSGYNFDAQQIIVEENGFGQYLLESEVVYSIAVDKGNRKWIGTLESGIYLLSEDGTNQIYHFTIENSPLISNTILDITINHTTGEVYISTEKGLMSFKNDAISSFNNISELEIIPNPVREHYYGAISIKGLAYESNVKITDIKGNLIFETISNGGMAIWNGENTNKQRVGTGVYLVFSSDKYGREKAVGKILFIQ